MPNEVFKSEDITLQDDTDVTLRPLPIGRLRRFMDAWAAFAAADTDDEGFDVFINCAGISLESHYKGKFDTLRATEEDKKKGEFLSGEYKSHLEDILDLETIYKILDVCGGVKLTTDPKALEEQARLLESLPTE